MLEFVSWKDTRKGEGFAHVASDVLCELMMLVHRQEKDLISAERQSVGLLDLGVKTFQGLGQWGKSFLAQILPKADGATV